MLVVVPVEVLFFIGVPHHEDEEAKVNAIEKVTDDHSIDFDVYHFSEIGKEPVFIFFSLVVSPFLDCF